MIKTWQQRQAETGIGSIEARDDEILELRQAIEQADVPANGFGNMIEVSHYKPDMDAIWQKEKEQVAPTAPAQPIKEVVVHADYREMWAQVTKTNQELCAALSKAQTAAPAQPSKYPCKLTDKELADPEYMRSYIEAMNQDYADLLYAAPAQPLTDEQIDAYCNAWEASFLAENPYQTVTITLDDRKHISVGLHAALNIKGASL